MNGPADRQARFLDLVSEHLDGPDFRPLVVDHLRDAWLRFRFRMRHPREEYSPLAARFAIGCSLPPLTRSLRRLNRALRFAARSATMLGRAMADPSPESECFMVRLPT